MSRYEVDSAQVKRTAAAVQGSAHQIGQQVDAMLRHLINLQNCWRGQASTSFQHVVTDWRTTQARVKGALDEIQSALAIAGQQYAQAEESAARMFAR